MACYSYVYILISLSLLGSQVDKLFAFFRVMFKWYMHHLREQMSSAVLKEGPEISDHYSFLVLQKAIGKLYETLLLLTLGSSQEGGFFFMLRNFRKICWPKVKQQRHSGLKLLSQLPKYFFLSIPHDRSFYCTHNFRQLTYSPQNPPPPQKKPRKNNCLKNFHWALNKWGPVLSFCFVLW